MEIWSQITQLLDYFPKFTPEIFTPVPICIPLLYQYLVGLKTPDLIITLNWHYETVKVYRSKKFVGYIVRMCVNEVQKVACFDKKLIDCRQRQYWLYRSINQKKA